MTNTGNSPERDQRLDEIIAAYIKARDVGEEPDHQEWIGRYPDFATDLIEFFGNYEAVKPLVKEQTQKSPEAQRDQIRIGDVFAGEYRIVDVKRGGMGCVYVADVIPKRGGDVPGRVAIKTVANRDERSEAYRSKRNGSDLATYSHILNRFRQEAEIWVGLGKQDNIIWAFFVLDVGAKPYIVMEYADGGDLRSWIKERRLSIPLAINLALQFCEGMRQAQRQTPLIHRDIKPANVLLTKDYLLKIADFGLAKAFDMEDTQVGTAELSDSSFSRAAGGTLAYMAPEQFQALSRADTRSDIYSFGAMLFEMLTLRQLFEAVDAREHFALRSKSVPDAGSFDPQISPALSAIVAKCLAYDPADRYWSFDELASQLWKVQDTLPGRLPIPKDGVEFPADWQIVQETYSLLSLGLYEKAVKCAQKGIETSPSNADHWINKAKALAELNDLRDSIECCQRATQLAPSNALAWANLGWAQMELGNPADGLETARHAIRLDESLCEGWLTQGVCEQKLGGLEDGVVSLRRSAELRPHDWRTHAHLGACLTELRRFTEADVALQRTLRINPNHAGTWTTLAVVLGSLNQFSKARDAIEHSLRLNDADSDAWAVRSIVMWHVEGPSPTVRDCLRKALDLNPGNPRAKQLVEMMGIASLEASP